MPSKNDGEESCNGRRSARIAHTWVNALTWRIFSFQQPILCKPKIICELISRTRIAAFTLRPTSKTWQSKTRGGCVDPPLMHSTSLWGTVVIHSRRVRHGVRREATTCWAARLLQLGSGSFGPEVSVDAKFTASVVPIWAESHAHTSLYDWQ